MSDAITAYKSQQLIEVNIRGTYLKLTPNHAEELIGQLLACTPYYNQLIGPIWQARAKPRFVIRVYYKAKGKHVEVSHFIGEVWLGDQLLLSGEVRDNQFDAGKRVLELYGSYDFDPDLDNKINLWPLLDNPVNRKKAEEEALRNEGEEFAQSMGMTLKEMMAKIRAGEL
jgi:hypothetical protein